jgi:peptidoglycan/xylan/chitin deacetylase (PgdA/CDA1 family)
MSLLRSGAKLAFAAIDLLHEEPHGPRILIYHQVGARLGRQMEVETDDFLWQLDWLMDNREVVDLGTAITRWSEPGSDRLVVITFDDGYRDTHGTAFPLMRERDIPFTLFLATGAIESGTGDERAEPLAWEDIEAMMATGLVTIGSHTHTHRDLRGASATDIEAELSTADQLIETRLGVAPRHFAYPWGYWSATADPVVRARYASAVLGAPRTAMGARDVHMIHRYPVQLSDGRRWFRTRLGGGLLTEERVRRRLRGYRGP